MDTRFSFCTNLGALFRAKGKDALGVGALVVVGREHIVEAIVSRLLKKPLDVNPGESVQCLASVARGRGRRRGGRVWQ